MKDFEKLPRLYINAPFEKDKPLSLSPTHAHYLRTVLRRQDGDSIRIFNGHDGEWLASLNALSKKSGTATLTKNLKPQPKESRQTHLFFAPIKKSRLDILIEKSVELSVTDFHPVLTARTENRKLNEERIQAQIIEAAEQCERLTIPAFHPMKPLSKIQHAGLFACLERQNAKFLGEIKLPANAAFLIGPEGGFTDEEMDMLNANKTITPISLGASIYRAETACLLCLAHAALHK